jgi:hypothetical protein
LVADALSRKEHVHSAVVAQLPDEIVEDFRRLNLGIVAHTEGVTIDVEPTLEQEIHKGQIGDAKIQEIKDLITEGRGPEFTEDEQDTVWIKNRICVPEMDNLRETILKEAHDSDYSIHPGSTKMYQDLKQKYWWYGLKRDVAEHVAMCVKELRLNTRGQLDYCTRLRYPSGSGKRLIWTSLLDCLASREDMILYGLL